MREALLSLCATSSARVHDWTVLVGKPLDGTPAAASASAHERQPLGLLSNRLHLGQVLSSMCRWWTCARHKHIRRSDWVWQGTAIV
jgi:hypothetical protein